MSYEEVDKKLVNTLNSFNDSLKTVFGQEYLSAFHKKLISRSAVKVSFSGDSTTANLDLAVSSRIDALTKTLMERNGVTGITVLNKGYAGKETNDWVTTYLAQDLSDNPDVYIIRWGINDPLDGRTAAVFETTLRNGLTTLRASKPLETMSVILMTPNTSNDDATGRGSAWHESINALIKKAARDFHCCFIDTYGSLKDGVNSNDWMDQVLGAGIHLHPQVVMNTWIGSIICDTLIPQYYKNANNTNTVSKLSSDLPSTYPKGESMFLADVGSGFPCLGCIKTSHFDYGVDVGILHQVSFGVDLAISAVNPDNYSLYFRTGYHYSTNNNWGAWISCRPTIVTAPTLLNSWVWMGVGYDAVGYYKDTNGIVHLKGIVKSGTIATAIFTLPAGYRPGGSGYYPNVSNGVFGSILIQGNGTVFANSGSNVYFSLSGISFLAEA